MGKAFRLLLLISLAFFLVVNVSGCSKKKVTDEEMGVGIVKNTMRTGIAHR